ncbi:glutaminase family protein [Sphingobacterium hungaricum]|uniref:Glutaminase n=1 Tax=Sphingobacterium hungaricum TaxID=2082723 RepID=A0A928UYW4_9SPHI|nr:glutaminase family protein [Sphingobacterium hungaricum]MBE8713945.1 glutaminase [Sphingobacterium hungaricum]
MKYFFLVVSTFLWLSFANGQDLYRSGYQTELRSPAVPLVTSDPYFSIWSPYNELTEGATEHWTGTKHPLFGAIRVDGKSYRFLGKNEPNLATVIPMSDAEKWNAQYTETKPASSWTSLDFNDASWKKGKASFGTKGTKNVQTNWDSKNIWIRRSFELSDIDKEANYILKYSHDDVFTLYLNGKELLKTDYSWNDNLTWTLTEEAKKLLKPGKNVIAVHCENRAGGAYVDFGLYKQEKGVQDFELAKQTSVNVMPTQSYYTFTCGPVEVNLVFTSPLLLDDLDLISTPISYISYQVKSLDKKQHDVQVYFETTPELAVNDNTQPIVTEKFEKNNFSYVKTGTVDQPYTKRVGDGVRIDWGYAYLSSPKQKDKVISFGNYFDLKDQFQKSGVIASGTATKTGIETIPNQRTALAYSHELKSVGTEGKGDFLMIGYDDEFAIEYFYKRKTAYWKHDGKVSMTDAFEKAYSNYASTMKKAKAFDAQLFQDATKAGGKEYAELCALAYRQSISAHKLIQDDQGNLLFLSKENHSNGCINTVDITYPSAPLYLIYNPDLLKGMLTGIFYYSESGRWNKPYPAHDLGTYPVANGQLYGEDMPIEEAGNMLLLTTAISILEKNTKYADKHWETLTIWANYLVENGLDPENQLCTDDFAGHLAHNANLSIKAIMGIAGYGKMAELKGDQATATKYTNLAKEMALEWKKLAFNQDHYKLAFDKEGSWSQKYNLVWDKLFDLNIFPKDIYETEVNFYLTKQNKYGLPLDSRETYTKSDWVLWSACLTDSDEDFLKFVKPMYQYANETTSRVAISDWHDTHSGKMMNFKARSVVGGYFMKQLFDKLGK